MLVGLEFWVNCSIIIEVHLSDAVDNHKPRLVAFIPSDENRTFSLVCHGSWKGLGSWWVEWMIIYGGGRTLQEDIYSY